MKKQLLALPRVMGFVANHPLNRNSRVGSLLRFARWQIGSRVVAAPVAVKFVNDSRLLVRRGMTGATGNIYTGLHEFEDMSFLLHFLRPDDVFVDVGANIGSYTILASAVVGASSISAEPISRTFAHLCDNIRLNNVSEIVDARNVGVGSICGELMFTRDRDTVNHVVLNGEKPEQTVAVPVLTLDELASGRDPILIKIDVEGYESEVLAGAERTLSNNGLKAVIMELNGNGTRYGFDEEVLHQKMLYLGFVPCEYKPFERTIVELTSVSLNSGNTLYIRETDYVVQRLQTAASFTVNGQRV